MRRTIAVDFDGVIATPNHWRKDVVNAEPMKGAEQALKLLNKFWDVIIFTSRLSAHNNPTDEQYRQNELLLLTWLNKHGFFEGEHFKGMTGDKIPALYYIDDHGLRFDGWESATRFVLDQQMVIDKHNRG